MECIRRMGIKLSWAKLAGKRKAALRVLGIWRLYHYSLLSLIDLFCFVSRQLIYSWWFFSFVIFFVCV